MAQLDIVEEPKMSAGARVVTFLGRAFIAIIIPLLAFAVLYAGFHLPA